MATYQDLVTRVQMEFIEMPGLRLTDRQARRLWNIDEITCTRLLTLLVEKGFLSRSRDGGYVRSGGTRLQNVDAA
jgi:DNA-binding IclR family transcriptional regulator